MINNIPATCSVGVWLAWWLAWMATGTYSRPAIYYDRSWRSWASWLLKVFAFCAMFKPVFFAPLVDFHFPFWLQLLGLSITFVGLNAASHVRFYLGENWSQFVSIKAAHVLITSGPYSYVRHPIYAALLLAMFGSLLSTGTLGSTLGFIALVWAFQIKLRQEETLLLTTFPVDYGQLMFDVPYRLVPGVY